MTSEDLLASIKALTLGQEQGPKDQEVNHVKSETASEDGPLITSALGNPLAIPPKQQSKQEMQTSILAATENNEAGALPALQNSTRKSKRSRRRKKTSKEAKPQIAFSALPDKRDEPAAPEAKKICAQQMFVCC